MKDERQRRKEQWVLRTVLRQYDGRYVALVMRVALCTVRREYCNDNVHSACAYAVLCAYASIYKLLVPRQPASAALSSVGIVTSSSWEKNSQQHAQQVSPWDRTNRQARAAGESWAYARVCMPCTYCVLHTQYIQYRVHT